MNNSLLIGFEIEQSREESNSIASKIKEKKKAYSTNETNLRQNERLVQRNEREQRAELKIWQDTRNKLQSTEVTTLLYLSN